jgi:GNAT superfamily N-acetyltransferase
MRSPCATRGIVGMAVPAPSDPRRAWIRPLGRADLPEIRAHLLSLDAAGRACRFRGAVSVETVAAYADRLDPEQVLLLGAFARGRLLGLVELHPVGTDGVAEGALSVAPAARSAGLGGRLLSEALTWAPGRGIRTLLLEGEADNAALARLLARHGARVQRGPDGICARLPVPPPPPGAVAAQWLLRPAILWHQALGRLLQPA